MQSVRAPLSASKENKLSADVGRMSLDKENTVSEREANKWQHIPSWVCSSLLLCLAAPEPEHGAHLGVENCAQNLRRDAGK